VVDDERVGLALGAPGGSRCADRPARLGPRQALGPFFTAIGSNATQDALRILEERFARGEIDEEEFERRRARLRDDGT
jgi:hypothetical protein